MKKILLFPLLTFLGGTQISSANEEAIRDYKIAELCEQQTEKDNERKTCQFELKAKMLNKIAFDYESTAKMLTEKAINFEEEISWNEQQAFEHMDGGSESKVIYHEQQAVVVEFRARELATLATQFRTRASGLRSQAYALEALIKPYVEEPPKTEKQPSKNTPSKE